MSEIIDPTSRPIYADEIAGDLLREILRDPHVGGLTELQAPLLVELFDLVEFHAAALAAPVESYALSPVLCPDMAPEMRAGQWRKTVELAQCRSRMTLILADLGEPCKPQGLYDCMN